MSRKLLRPDCRGLLLDACNILYDDTAWRRWLLRLLRRLGLRTTCGCFFHVFQRDYLGDVYCGRRTFDEALAEYLRSVGLSCGQIDEVATAFVSYRRSAENDVRPLTHVRRALGELRAADLALGVLCNTEQPGPVLRERLDRLFGEPLFAAVVSSRDLGRAMPDGACYAAALEAIGLPARHVAFVGHDAMELAGARAAGLATVAFNADSDAQADVQVYDLGELLDLAAPPLLHAAA
jgi:FMN phosphatase YigB (HAD superfamily)